MSVFIQSCCLLTVLLTTANLLGAPTIDPLPPASIPAGKSLTIPIMATSPNGRPLTYTVTSSTNRISVEVHTNNPFWKMSVVQLAPSNSPGAFLTPFRGGAVMVTNHGDMVFMLLRDRAPRTVDAISALTTSGFYNSNTIFHRVVLTPYFIIQGGDPTTNGTGGPVYRIDDEFHPRSLYSGSGQLGTANSGPDTVGSQFFVTATPQRDFDLRYTIFGQLIRGFDVMSNILHTPVNASSRPLADAIITRASLVPNLTDTAITLTGTNFPGVAATIRVIADDGAGGRATNTFTATTVSDTANNAPPILYPNTVTNLVAPVNGRLTNFISAMDLENNTRYFDAYFWDANAQSNSANSDFSVTFATGKFVVVPNVNYTGPLRYYVAVSQDPFFFSFDLQRITFAIGDTPIGARGTNFVAQPLVPLANQLLATFTNGVPTSAPGNFTASINWGDNSTNAATIVTNAAGQKEVRGSHTYTNSGHYPVYVTIRSALGAQAVVTSTAIVPPVLSYTRWGNTNRLHWPAWAAEYQVQSHTNPATAHWLPLTNPPALNGYDNVLFHTNGASREFFRLKR